MSKADQPSLPPGPEVPIGLSPEVGKTADPVAAPKAGRRFRRHLSILPNVFTSLNLVCGYFSIIATANQEFLLAGWLIVLAVLCDILDGRVARLADVTSKFGAELDSLADLVSFGVAPGFLVFSRYLSENLILGMLVSGVFVLCGALRLARFNVTPPSGKDVFEGLPIPAGAGILCTLTIIELQFFRIFIPDFFIPIVVVLTSFLMVSTIEYPAMKKSKRTGLQRQALVVFFLGALIVNTPLTLFLVTWGFASYGLVVSLLRKVIGLFRRSRPLSETHPAPPPGN